MSHASPAAAHLAQGTALLKAGSVREAERELRRAIELDAGCAGAWVNLGGIHFSRWEYAASVEANHRAAEAEPALAIAHFNEALGHLQLGEAERAVASLTRVVELEPGNGGAFHHLAIALYALGRPAEARLCVAYAKELGYRPNELSRAALEHAEAAAAEGGGTQPPGDGRRDLHSP